MTRLIAIDPSAKFLWAVYPVERKLAYVAVPTDPWNMDSWFRQMRWLQFGAVAYEDCYLSRNAKTYAGLVSLRERVREAAEKNGLEFRAVSPSVWQSALLLLPGESKQNALRNARKERAFALATYILDSKPKTQDLADAVCLWYYTTNPTPVTFERLLHNASSATARQRQQPPSAPPEPAAVVGPPAHKGTGRKVKARNVRQRV